MVKFHEKLQDYVYENMADLVDRYNEDALKEGLHLGDMISFSGFDEMVIEGNKIGIRMTKAQKRNGVWKFHLDGKLNEEEADIVSFLKYTKHLIQFSSLLFIGEIEKLSIDINNFASIDIKEIAKYTKKRDDEFRREKWKQGCEEYFLDVLRMKDVKICGEDTKLKVSRFGKNMKKCSLDIYGPVTNFTLFLLLTCGYIDVHIGDFSFLGKFDDVDILCDEKMLNTDNQYSIIIKKTTIRRVL